jgi:hypothetical protein
MFTNLLSRFPCRFDGNEGTPWSYDHEGFTLVGFKLSNVIVIYLPPNTTALIQPLDQGVIRSWKCTYRQLLLDWLLANDVGGDLTQLKPTFKQCVEWIVSAWNTVPTSVVANAW